ncbi:colicin uptake protein TolQ [Roseimaritima multifibrata]|uniref:Colicin uptake protein TolQ n=1 Tax=Roseimaritima multifibrata TaxID=1930274 RepID=A0A517MMS7_9BACT|nr:colicin uptake protein TolQ [Roseimaritima multifibrata]
MSPLLTLNFQPSDQGAGSASSSLWRGSAWAAIVVVTLLAVSPFGVGLEAWGQDVPVSESAIEDLLLPDPADNVPPGGAEQDAKPSGIDLMTLIGSGGKFMIPIAVMSMLVVTLSVERFISLRRGRVVPRRLVKRLQQLADPVTEFDPKAAYKACQENRSVAADVVIAMLQRTGQPVSEIERIATEATQRKADDFGGPIRWLNLAAAATPLMGLLGTVWGMIVAFHESTTLTVDRSRSEQLSEGIYTALVTTLAGLIVAIPAAIMAQYLENRLIRLFHRIEELTFTVAPGFERFAGRMRFDPRTGISPIRRDVSPPPVAGGTQKSNRSADGKRTAKDSTTAQQG